MLTLAPTNLATLIIRAVRTRMTKIVMVYEMR